MPECPQCPSDELIDAEEDAPDDAEVEEDWFCARCGGLFTEDEVEG